VTRLREESGLTLIEVLIAASLMLIVMSATMTLLSASNRQQRLVDEHNEAQQEVRVALDRMARELRNLASPADLSSAAVLSGAGALPRSVERNLPYDLVFQNVRDVRTPGSSNVTNVGRTRYCLDATDRERGVLWQQRQTWTTAAAPLVPADTACPGTGWDDGGDRSISAAVTNRAGGVDRPLFRYAGVAGTITATDGDARADVARVRADLHVDPTPGRSPRATHLATAVFLRNQNREPLASFTITGLNPTTRLIDLNGTASTDPEGQLLNFQFYYDPPSPLPVCDVEPPLTPDPSCILPASARMQFTVPAAGVHRYVLKVSDPSGLIGTAEKEFSYP
jgi:type II secretory pathway component PulJ